MRSLGGRNKETIPKGVSKHSFFFFVHEMDTTCSIDRVRQTCAHNGSSLHIVEDDVVTRMVWRDHPPPHYPLDVIIEDHGGKVCSIHGEGDSLARHDPTSSKGEFSFDLCLTPVLHDQLEVLIQKDIERMKRARTLA